MRTLQDATAWDVILQMPQKKNIGKTLVHIILFLLLLVINKKNIFWQKCYTYT